MGVAEQTALALCLHSAHACLADVVVLGHRPNIRQEGLHLVRWPALDRASGKHYACAPSHTALVSSRICFRWVARGRLREGHLVVRQTMVQQTLVQNGTTSSSHRAAQAKYWKEHSATATVEAMMLDSQAKIIDKQERPEVRSWEAVRPAEISDMASTGGAAPAARHESAAAQFVAMLRQFQAFGNGFRGVHAAQISSHVVSASGLYAAGHRMHA
jgi:hypothetical protein